MATGPRKRYEPNLCGCSGDDGMLSLVASRRALLDLVNAEQALR